MPSGYPHSRSTRRELFDRVCQGAPLIRTAREMGVSTTSAWLWWRDAGGMKLLTGKGDLGLAEPGDLGRLGGRGHRISYDERVEIMRGLDLGRRPADIARRLGRDRSVIGREIKRNRNPDGDYHARMAHARATQEAKRPKQFKLDDIRLCARIERWMDDGWSPRACHEFCVSQR
jgi:transposase, IS30 family